MNKYEKPQLEIKSLIQTVAITVEEEEDDSNSALVSILPSWWPFS